MKRKYTTVLVTGATSGIGLHLSECFAKRGYDLVLVARSADKLRERKETLEVQYGVRVEILQQDLSEPDAAQKVFDAVSQMGLEIDVLVNNAGFGNFGNYVSTSWEKDGAMIRLNVVCVAQLTKLFLPGMVERHRGKILNLASTAAFVPGPGMSVYYATKAFVLSFSQALSRELEGTGVTVTALCPGPTDTNFSNAANLRKSKIYSYFKSAANASAAKVAEYGYKSLQKGKAVAIQGILNKALVFAARLAPLCLLREILYAMQEHVQSDHN